MSNLIAMPARGAGTTKCGFCEKPLVPRSALNIPAYCSYEHAAAANPHLTAQSLRRSYGEN